MTSFETAHRVFVGDARDLSDVGDSSIQLVVTSPPYPMIEMWDGVFAELIGPFRGGDFRPASPGFDGWPGRTPEEAAAAFERMHAELDRVWAACHRVLTGGGLACINVGDATRTIGGEFRLFANHARIIAGMERAGFTTLPDILWRKPTNAPNKFMGSGMLPAGAYVTYEHEYILIFRKGPKRVFASAPEKDARRRSAYFWEERNVWFSDVWTDLVGARQGLGDPETRARSAAFPLELPYRLIQMFSVFGDTVLDPFAGSGTTLAAALASGRNSIGIERDAALAASIGPSLVRAARIGNDRSTGRLREHCAFVAGRREAGKTLAHDNRTYGFAVVTGQEEALELVHAIGVEDRGGGRVIARHAIAPRESAVEGQGSLFPGSPR